MKLLYILFFVTQMLQSQILFDVQSKTNMDNWKIVNDDVMGGRSKVISKYMKDMQNLVVSFP